MPDVLRFNNVRLFQISNDFDHMKMPEYSEWLCVLESLENSDLYPRIREIYLLLCHWPMHSAKFEIECSDPELVKKAVEVDDKSEVKYSSVENKLIFEIRSDCLKSLMKIAYSACNRVELSIETIKKFKKPNL